MVKFLHDAPADEDLFGAHSAIADAILDTVCVDHRLRIIGLSGSWGSGKSTVVKQLAKKLIVDSRCSDYIFFEYDAWLTQNDPPRRSFMEALIPFLIEKEILNKEDWTRRLDILKGKVQESIKTTTPILTWKSIVFLKTYLLFAIGLFILNKVEFNKFFNDTATSLDRSALSVGITLILLAPLAMIAIHLRERFIEKLALDQRSVVPRLLNKSIDTNRETTTRLLEPTSIEFRDEFRDIMMEVGAKKYRLMLVLDNVDRLSDEEALSLWSTMRSFFVDRLGQDFSVTYAPIVIVPVDIGSLTRLFVKNGDGKSRGKEIAQSYIDKTFDVVFDVREPAVADWRKFFDKVFEDAVGDVYTSWDIHQARRIYEYYAVSNERKTTPRAVIRLANAASALVSTSTKVPLPTIVLYVLNKADIEDGISKWVTADNRDFSEFDREWKLNLAALYFMTDQKKAVGPLLKDDVAAAIIGGIPEKVAEYQDIEGLGDVISELAHDPPLDSDGKLKLGALATIADVLREYGSAIHGSPLWKEEAEASLTKAFIRLDAAQTDLSRLRSMIEYLGSLEGDKLPIVRAAVGMIHWRLSAQRLDSASLDVLADALDAVEEVARSNNLGALEVPIAGEVPLALTRQYGIYRRSKNWKCIKGPTDQAAIDAALATRLEDPVAKTSVPDMIRMLSLSDVQRLVLPADVDDSPLLTAIGETIENAEKSEFLTAAVEAMVELQLDSPELTDVVKGWADDGQLTARFNEAVNAGDQKRVWALISLGVAAGVYFDGSALDPWPTQYRTQQAIKRPLELFSKRSASDRIELVWAAIRSWKFVQPLLYNLRNQLIAALDSKDVDANALLKDYENTIIQAGRATFLDFLVRDKKAEISLTEISPDGLVKLLALPNISGETRRKVLAAIVKATHSAPADGWTEWILKGGPIFQHWEAIKKASSEKLGKRSGLARGLQSTSSTALADSVTLKRWLQALEVGSASVVHDAKVAMLGQIAELQSASKAISLLRAISPTDANIQAAGVNWSALLVLIISKEEGRKWIDANGLAVRKRVKAFSPADAKALRAALEALAKGQREGRRLWAEKALKEWFHK